MEQHTKMLFHIYSDNINVEMIFNDLLESKIMKAYNLEIFWNF